jgi:hypothetical protein
MHSHFKLIMSSLGNMAGLTILRTWLWHASPATSTKARTLQELIGGQPKRSPSFIHGTIDGRIIFIGAKATCLA